MTTRLVRFLVFVLSFHLAMPPAWCCYLTAGPCCKESPKPTETKKKAKCCCEECETADDAPVTPKKAPPAPTTPCDSPCCVHEPTTLVDRDFGQDGVAIAISVDAVSSSAVVSHISDDSFPPVNSLSTLHVLHCRWLC